MYPEKMEEYLIKNKVSRTKFATQSKLSRTTVLRHFKKFNIKGYVIPKKTYRDYICSQCGEHFNRYVPPIQVKVKEKVTYCSPVCYHDSLRKANDGSLFRLDLDSYKFTEPAKRLGDYSELVLSKRHLHTIGSKKINHTFFNKGIINELTAYIFGIWLTDGHVGYFRNGKKLDEIKVEYNSRGQKIIGSYIASLQLSDIDIVEKIAKVLENKNKLTESYGTYKGVKTKKTKILFINSPYFNHDLASLGCGIKKTYYANYPLIHDQLDRHFLRGILDGDGSVQISKEGRLSIKFCGNDQLMYGIFLKLKQHLSITPVAVSYPSEEGMLTFCEIRYGLQESLAIREWLYKDAIIFGERKYKKAFEYKTPLRFQNWSTQKLADHLGTSIYFIQENVYKENLPHTMVGTVVSFQPEHIPYWEKFLGEQLKNPRSRFKHKTKLQEKWGAAPISKL
ncbi:hypothetical protein [Cytobacillus luteolus]|nr:hypothetical protein [Cytobacillus luteolus]MBP1943958.1 hypothetical protein [Cytobacillus luteolus]